jgi:predicted SAM-dependent methyltransferase
MRKFPEYKKPYYLNIGSGNDNKKDYINIDNRDLGDNMVWDVNDGLPFPDNSVEHVFSSHFIEHLDDRESINFLREIIRVLKPKGLAVIYAPYATTTGAIMWGHKTFWNTEKIDSIYKLEESLGSFVLIENREQEGQLLFSLQKI